MGGMHPSVYRQEGRYRVTHIIHSPHRKAAVQRQERSPASVFPNSGLDSSAVSFVSFEHLPIDGYFTDMTYDERKARRPVSGTPGSFSRRFCSMRSALSSRSRLPGPEERDPDRFKVSVSFRNPEAGPVTRAHTAAADRPENRRRLSQKVQTPDRVYVQQHTAGVPLRAFAHLSRKRIQLL